MRRCRRVRRSCPRSSAVAADDDFQVLVVDQGGGGDSGDVDVEGGVSLGDDGPDLLDGDQFAAGEGGGVAILVEGGGGRDGVGTPGLGRGADEVEIELVPGARVGMELGDAGEREGGGGPGGALGDDRRQAGGGGGAVRVVGAGAVNRGEKKTALQRLDPPVDALPSAFLRHSSPSSPHGISKSPGRSQRPK